MWYYGKSGFFVVIHWSFNMPSVARIAQKSFLKIHNTWELPGTSLPWPVVFKAVLRPPAFCPPPLKNLWSATGFSAYSKGLKTSFAIKPCGFSCFGKTLCFNCSEKLSFRFLPSSYLDGYLDKFRYQIQFWLIAYY